MRFRKTVILLVQRMDLKTGRNFSFLYPALLRRTSYLGPNWIELCCPKCRIHLGLSGGTVVKNLPASARDTKAAGMIPELGRFLGEENGNLPLYPCLENSMDRGGWQAVVHGTAKSRIQQHTHTGIEYKLHQTKFGGLPWWLSG